MLISDEDSAVPLDMMVAALHCLDNELRTVLDQFTRVSTLAASARRVNVVDVLFLPPVGARKRLDALPLTGRDLLAGQFQESMETMASTLRPQTRLTSRNHRPPHQRRRNTNRPRFCSPPPFLSPGDLPLTDDAFRIFGGPGLRSRLTGGSLRRSSSSRTSGVFHPAPGDLHLKCWVLSRNPSEQRVFYNGLRKLPPSPGGPPLGECMIASYAISLNGVDGELYIQPILL